MSFSDHGMSFSDRDLALSDHDQTFPDRSLRLSDRGSRFPDRGLRLPDCGMSFQDRGLPQERRGLGSHRATPAQKIFGYLRGLASRTRSYTPVKMDSRFGLDQ